MDAHPAMPGASRQQWRTHAVGVLLAVIVVLATTFEIHDDQFVLVAPRRWVEGLVLVTAAATLFAQRFPYAALGVAAVLDAVPYWLPIAAPGYHLSLMFTVYFVMAHDRPRRTVPPVALVFAAQVGLMAWHKDWTWTAMPVVYAGVSVLVPATLGFAAHARVVAGEAVRQQVLAEDRLRTAQDLHDSVAHQIAVMNLHAGVASGALRDHPDQAESALRTVREAGRAVIGSISDLLAGLREDQPAGPGDGAERRGDTSDGLADLRRLVEEFRRLSPGLAATVRPEVPDGTGTTPDRDPPAGPLLHAVVREALTNAYKHGRHDAPALLEVSWTGDAWVVEMTNTSTVVDGADERPAGFGLRGMRERLTAAGGELELDPSGGRFALRARVPAGASR